jgi:DNA helicase-2/ATP-dependent DNA helicase PcrA
MDNIRSILNCNQNEAKYAFSEADIKWVENIMGLKSGFDDHQLAVLQNLSQLDVEACPGSGKTTVLVAKLALLSRYWTSKSKGICVLSMTNAAREEIQKRLGNTEEGQRLLKPPHFIGTIHSFYSDFLAKPFLNSKNMSIVSIDDDHCRSQRRKTLQKKNYLPLTDYLLNQQVKSHTEKKKPGKEHTKEYIEAEQWLIEHEEKSLEEKRLGIPIYWKMINEKYDVVRITQGGDKQLEILAEHQSLLQECIEEVAHKGIFAFSDIFVYARALMGSSKQVFDIMRTRFPILFIDEAQDTSSSQAEILHELFLSSDTGSLKTIRQRFGDANQTIFTFEEPMLPDGLDPYPSPKIHKLSLPVSHRFDNSISAIASKFETTPLQIPMQGMRVDNLGGRNHCVLLFNEQTRNHVIPMYAELVAKELSASELKIADLRICSHIHKEKKDIASTEDYARTIRDYYSPYIADKMTKEYQQHKYLIDYLRHARYLVRDSKSLSLGLEKFAEGILRVALIVSNDSEVNTKNTPFKRIKSLPQNKHRAICREVTDKLSLEYSKEIINLLTSISHVSENSWGRISSIVSLIINALLNQVDIDSITTSSLKWQDEEDSCCDIQNITIERNNIYKHKLMNNMGNIDFKIGTIHSVKGQTHTATLILESTNRGPILGQLKPYFLHQENASEAKSSKREWLNTLYVGLTRPTHLVCLAIPETHKKTGTSKIDWSNKELQILKVNGWKVARVNKELGLVFL